MKIKRVYIENFGGLSKFTLNFNDNLTCINQHNGYGKTTLAEFIRAIFYGFCGTGDLNKNKERKKFMPWSGGKFGGYIDFECDGSNYRLERFFGKTARSDEAKLYNLDNNKIAPNFNPDTFGYQIFGIDSDSFIRSAYIRANPDNDKFDTDGIKAKLANLVDDTDDVGNFDKAKQAIKEARLNQTSNTRGKSVYNQSSNMIQSLDSKLNRLRGIVNQKKEVLEDIDEKERQLEEYKQSLQDIKVKIHSVNNKIAKQTVNKQLSDVKTEINEQSKIISEFSSKYSKGFPSDDEIMQLVDSIRKIEALNTQSDTLKTESITNISIGDKEIHLEIEELPTEKELNAYREWIDAIIVNKTQLQNIKLSEVKQDRLNKLKAKFRDKMPTDNDIDEAIQLNSEINNLEASRDKINLVDLEKQLEVYKFCFSDSIPTLKEIDNAKEKLKQAEKLKELNNQLACEIGNIPKYDQSKSDIQVSKKQNSLTQTVLIILGALGIVAGVILGTVVNKLGFIGCPIGTVFMLLGGLSYTKNQNNSDQAIREVKDVKEPREAYNSSDKLRDKMLDNSEKLKTLEAEVELYISKFAIKGDKLSDKLSALSQTLSDFNKANNAYQEASINIQKLNIDIEDRKETIRKLVGKQSSLEEITNLKIEIKEINELKAELDRSIQREKELNNEINTNMDKVSKGLSRFYHNVTIDNASELLDKLTKDIISYKSKHETLKKMEAEEKARQDTIKQEENSIISLLNSYDLKYNTFGFDEYNKMIDEQSEYIKAKDRVDKLNKKYESIMDENAEVLSYSILDDTELTIDELKERENSIVDVISKCSISISNLKSDIEEIEEAEDLIPDVEEALEYYIRIRDESQEKASMLDKLGSLLDEAKDRLSKKYLYEVTDNFKELAYKIMPSIVDKSSISSDLNILINELGAFKERDTLSSGEMDAINLCMRLALTKTMFKKNAPIIILDDPFIHLDDTKIKKSTEVIKELSSEYQILYLTCSESREINT